MRLLIIIFFFCMPLVGSCQDTDQQLAQHYYNNGEFDKALIYYEKIYAKDNSKFNFKRYFECLTETGQDKQAEKLVKKEISRNKGDNEYGVLLADFYEDRGQLAKANKIYDELIEDMIPSSRSVISLYNLFKAQGKTELSHKTLIKGRKILRNSYPLNFQFAEYYGSQGETEKMLGEYIDIIDYHAAYVKSVKRVLSSQIDFNKEESKEYDMLKNELISRTQKDPENLVYADMLTWVFIQRQNFPAALIHVNAMDRRSKSGGRMLYDFGNVCVENNDFSTAKKSFKAVIEKGEGTNYFGRAQNALLNVSFLEVTTRRNFTEQELSVVIADYEQVLSRYGENRNTLPIILELAHIQAFYAGKGKDAIILLEKTKLISNLSAIELAQVKMQLADIHVLHGDIWESSLLYMQIDNSFKYEPIGHEAKFKNARIFYYDAEFDFAQSQLDVLKQSTTKLIANDALKLSLLITDNFGLDSNYTVMTWFASADLLIEQHKFHDAYILFDSILNEFPEHSLGDEILLKKAEVMQKKGEWLEAISVLEELVKYHGNDILADDALFQLGEIYDYHLFQKEKASEYYRKILFDYKGSLYTTEARKRFQSISKSSKDLEEL
ncbi:MAG: tetratricopeptide repeat protein [Flavobacteriales bacterium]|nr:tetratricopeptide repeat protein [Flavobacteriales bacterium]